MGSGLCDVHGCRQFLRSFIPRWWPKCYLQSIFTCVSSLFSKLCCGVLNDDIDAAPPTNQSTFHKWTVGPIYYSSLVVAEALGPSNTSQVVDLAANNNNTFTPAYGIWEHGQLSRVLLINFVSDNSSASDLSVSLTTDGNGLPGSVKVK